MSYPVIASRRMPYDIDGTEVGRRYSSTGFGMDSTYSTTFSQGVQAWLTPTQRGLLNDHTQTTVLDAGSSSYQTVIAVWFFLPEQREITHLGFFFPATYLNTRGFPTGAIIQGSNDSTNGMDGTWETAIYTYPGGSIATDYWRAQVKSVSFSGPKRVLRVGFMRNPSIAVASIHLYGSKAAGQTPHDVLIMANTMDEFPALKDWGDRPEGTVEFTSFRLKNASPTKTANAVNVQLNHDDFLLSWSDTGPWVTFVDIASLSPGAVSSPIYIRNALGPPLLTLGPRAARVVVGVDSWA